MKGFTLWRGIIRRAFQHSLLWLQTENSCEQWELPSVRGRTDGRTDARTQPRSERDAQKAGTANAPGPKDAPLGVGRGEEEFPVGKDGRPRVRVRRPRPWCGRLAHLSLARRRPRSPGSVGGGRRRCGSGSGWRRHLRRGRRPWRTPPCRGWPWPRGSSWLCRCRSRRRRRKVSKRASFPSVCEEHCCTEGCSRSPRKG